MTDDLFERARAQCKVASQVKTKLGKSGSWLRGECPLCGASKGKVGGSAAFVVDGAERWFCFGCEESGDVIELVAETRYMSRVEAAQWILGPEYAPAAKVEPSADQARASEPGEAAARNAARAADIWHEATPATGTLVETYLASRHIDGRVLALMCRRLRFHPRVLWGRSGNRWVHAPGMVGAYHTAAGPTGGVHVTFLRADGRGKADLDPAKRMFGPTADAEGRPGAVWLIGPKGVGDLVVGEGIESAGAAAVLHGEPCRLAATTDLRRLQGGWLADQWNRRDPDVVRSDPASPPFTWPLRDIGVERVLIAVDRDMSPIKIKARKAMGGTYERILGAEDRARICGSLAEQAWHRANPQLPPSAFRTVAPAPGRDFSDELMEARA